MKLHGSLNWFLDDNGRIVPKNFLLALQNGTTYRTHESGQYGHAFVRHLDLTLKNREPIIVPPTWNKESYQSKLIPVWRAAAEHLSEAEHIVICEYSFPTTDEAIKYLFALGTIGSSRSRTVAVVDPYPSKQLDNRVRGILGPRAIARYSLRRGTFAGFTNAFPNRNIGVADAIDNLQPVRIE